MDLCEFEVNLFYNARFRADRAKQRKALSGDKMKQNKTILAFIFLLPLVLFSPDLWWWKQVGLCYRVFLCLFFTSNCCYLPSSWFVFDFFKFFLIIDLCIDDNYLYSFFPSFLPSFFLPSFFLPSFFLSFFLSFMFSFTLPSFLLFFLSL